MKPSQTKKSKKPLIITIIILVIIAAAGLVYYFFFFNKSPKIVLTDSQYLAETKSWEMMSAPTVIWSFNVDGTGELTTNKSNYYPITWELNDNKLEIVTDWLYELKDEFDISIDRENNSFTVKNLADDKESIFVPLGSQVPPEEGQESQEKAE